MSPNNVFAGNQILIRGDAAAQAQAIDLVRQTAGQPITAIESWATELDGGRDVERERGFEQGHSDGHSEGLTLGLQQGRQQMVEQVDQRLGDLANTLDTVLNGIDERNRGMCENIAGQITELALEIAEAVLGHEVASAIDPGADAITRCLELAPASGDVVARLHPADLAQLGEVTALADRKLSVTADPTLQRGDAVITVDDATVDARLAESLRRVGEALR